MASEAKKLIDQLIATGEWSKASIGRALDRDEAMIRRVTSGRIPGTKYEDALRDLVAGREPAPIERGPVAEQKTPAGRYTQVTARGMKGLMRSLGRDTLERSYLRIEYRDKNGQVQEGTLYRNGGEVRADILEMLLLILEQNGGSSSDPADILEALEGLIDYENGRPRGGASNLHNIAAILTVRVEPA